MSTNLLWIVGALAVVVVVIWRRLLWSDRRAAAGTRSTRPEADAAALGLTQVEVVIARHLYRWTTAEMETAWAYANGLVTGEITAATSVRECRRVPAALGRKLDEDHVDEGDFFFTINERDWLLGITRIHALAHGVVECIDGGRYGIATQLRASWILDQQDLDRGGLTLDEFAHAFAGDIPAAANAYLRAWDAMPSIR